MILWWVVLFIWNNVGLICYYWFLICKWSICCKWKKVCFIRNIMIYIVYSMSLVVWLFFLFFLIYFEMFLIFWFSFGWIGVFWFLNIFWVNFFIKNGIIILYYIFVVVMYVCFVVFFLVVFVFGVIWILELWCKRLMWGVDGVCVWEDCFLLFFCKWLIDFFECKKKYWSNVIELDVNDVEWKVYICDWRFSGVRSWRLFRVLRWVFMRVVSGGKFLIVLMEVGRLGGDVLVVNIWERWFVVIRIWEGGWRSLDDFFRSFWSFLEVVEILWEKVEKEVVVNGLVIKGVKFNLMWVNDIV